MSTEPTVTLPLPLEYQEAVVQKLSPFELITNTLFCDELDGALYRTNLGKRPQLRVTLRTLETTGMITVDVLDSFGAVEGTWNIVPKFIEYAPDMYHNCLFKMNEITVVSNVPETEIDTNRSAVFTVHLIRLARQLYKNVDFSIIFNETNSIPEEEPGFHWGRMEEAREIRFIKTKLRPKEYMTLQKYLMPQHILYLDDENFPVVKCLTVQTIVIKKCPDFTVRKFRLFSCRHLIVNYRVMDGRTINRYLMHINKTLTCHEHDDALYRTNLGKRPNLRVTVRNFETRKLTTVDLLDSSGAVEGTWNITTNFIERPPDMDDNCLFKIKPVNMVSNVPETEIITNNLANFLVFILTTAKRLYRYIDFSIIFEETTSIPEEEFWLGWKHIEKAREIRFIETELRPKEYKTLKKHLKPHHILYLDDECFPVDKCLKVRTIVIKKCPDFTVRKFRLFACRHLIVNYRVMDGRAISRYLMQWIGGTHPELKFFKVLFAKKNRVLQGLNAKKADASALTYNFGGQIHDLSNGYEIENCFGKRGTIKFQNRGLIFVVEPTSI
uniref:F-box domain-containing protein n=1 Tax=Caenorhabditis tropicalis TaxID=1561998 RepID=A0A1I7T9T1_9PELO